MYGCELKYNFKKDYGMEGDSYHSITYRDFSLDENEQFLEEAGKFLFNMMHDFGFFDIYIGREVEDE